MYDTGVGRCFRWCRLLCVLVKSVVYFLVWTGLCRCCILLDMYRRFRGISLPRTSELWWYRYELPDTHATLLSVSSLSAAGGKLAAAQKSRHSLTLSNCHFTHNSVSVFMSLRCMDDKISWLGGWASQWRPPQST